MRSSLIYSILFGLIRGRLNGLLKAQHDRDGYKCWVQMLNEMEPQNNARGLALLTTLLEKDSSRKGGGF